LDEHVTVLMFCKVWFNPRSQKIGAKATLVD